jgi:hypothetical protein
MSHIFAGDDYGVRIAAVVTNRALVLGSDSLSWRNQDKDHGERN